MPRARRLGKKKNNGFKRRSKKNNGFKLRPPTKAKPAPAASANKPRRQRRTPAELAVHGLYTDALRYASRGDWPNAASWYTKAAEAGHAGAMHALSECYKNGSSLTMDFVYQWFLEEFCQASLGPNGFYVIAPKLTLTLTLTLTQVDPIAVASLVSLTILV